MKDKTIPKVHKITDPEMKYLSLVASMEDVRSPDDFIYILNAIRQALDKQPNISSRVSPA